MTFSISFNIPPRPLFKKHFSIVTSRNWCNFFVDFISPVFADFPLNFVIYPSLVHANTPYKRKKYTKKTTECETCLISDLQLTGRTLTRMVSYYDLSTHLYKLVCRLHEYLFYN